MDSRDLDFGSNKCVANVLPTRLSPQFLYSLLYSGHRIMAKMKMPKPFVELVLFCCPESGSSPNFSSE